jgi:hypothetical protein
MLRLDDMKRPTFDINWLYMAFSPLNTKTTRLGLAPQLGLAPRLGLARRLGLAPTLVGLVPRLVGTPLVGLTTDLAKNGLKVYSLHFLFFIMQ